MIIPLWMLWLGSTVLPLGALWLLWRLALRSEQCYRYNQVLLLLAPALAAGLPLVPLPALPAWLGNAADPAAGLLPVLLPALAAPASSGPAAASWSHWSWLLGVYLVGVALGLGRLAWQVGRLHWLARHLPREAGPGYVLVRTGGQLPTSSFGQFIFWDETIKLTLTEAAAVLAHEVAHVRQRHTLDVLWLECWRVVLWPNPFAHLLLPALRLTHELLADRAAAAAVADNGSLAYATLLARLAARRLAGPAVLPLLQPFTFSFILTRIAMLQNQIPVRRWKQWLVLPVLGALLFVVSHAASGQPGPAGRAQVGPGLSEPQRQERSAIIRRKVQQAQHEDSLRTGGKFEPGTVQQVNIANMNGAGELVVTITRVKRPSPPTPIANATADDGKHVYTYVEQMPQLPGGGYVAAIIKQIQANLIYPAGEQLEGRVFASFTVSATGEVLDAKIIKGLSTAYDAATLAAIQKLPRFEPGKQNGQPVAVSFTVPVMFKNKP